MIDEQPMTCPVCRLPLSARPGCHRINCPPMPEDNP